MSLACNGERVLHFLQSYFSRCGSNEMWSQSHFAAASFRLVENMLKFFRISRINSFGLRVPTTNTYFGVRAVLCIARARYDYQAVPTSQVNERRLFPSVAVSVLAASVAFTSFSTKLDVTTNKISGKEAEQYLTNMLRKAHRNGIETQVRMKAQDGSIRVVDVWDKECDEICEVKVGKLNKSKKLARQVAKDLFLRDQYGYKPQIHFFKSLATGLVGPSQSCAEFLKDNEITMHVHNHTASEGSDNCRACKGLTELVHAGAADGAEPTAATNAHATPEKSIAVCFEGAVNLVVALITLALALESASKLKKMEDQLPELKKEAAELLSLMHEFSLVLQQELDLHLPRVPSTFEEKPSAAST